MDDGLLLSVVADQLPPRLVTFEQLLISYSKRTKPIREEKKH